MSHTHVANLSVEKLPDSAAVINGELTLELLAECRGEALKHLGESARLDGFRPGHIPEDVLVQKLGEMRILEETAEIAIGREYGQIIDEVKVVPIGRPRVSITQMTPGQPLAFRIEVALEPEFSLPDYKALAAAVPSEADPQLRGLKIIEALLKATDISVPQVLIESELEKVRPELRDDLRPQALDRVKAELILAKIAATEKIEPPLDELEAEAKHLLEHHPDADPLRLRLYVYSVLRDQKVLEFLESQK